MNFKTVEYISDKKIKRELALYTFKNINSGRIKLYKNWSVRNDDSCKYREHVNM